MSAGFLNPSAGLGNGPADPVSELLARQQIAKLLAKGQDYTDASPKTHPMQVLAQTVQGALAGLDARQQIAAQLAGQQAAAADFAKIGGSGSTGSLGGTGTGVQGAARLPAMAGGGQAMTMPAGDSGAIQGRFTDALKAGGLTNPYGLAAMTAYAQHESRYSPKNIGGTWSDPSERGVAGTSGGILSWRNERLSSMQKATAGAQDPVTAQAKFALTENPELTLALQNAKSPEEANALMAQAWKFAGYDRPGGGEYANRLATTQAYASKFAGDQAAASPQDASPADMPAPNAKPVDMAADGPGALPRTPEGFTIPPAPGEGSQDPGPAAPSQARADLAALFSGAPMGPAQSFSGTSGTVINPDAADMPAPGAQPASTAPMQVPLPPARPSAADLQAPAAPSPARQQLAQVIAQPRTDAPDPQSAPGPAPREGIAALLGGFQDGLDRVFGGAQTQARLDAQSGPLQQIAQALTPPTQPQYAALPPAGRAAPAPGVAQPARAAAQPTPPQAAPAAPEGVPAAPQQPVQVAQAGGMPAPASSAASPQQAYSPRAQELMGFINKWGAYPAAKSQVETAQKLLEMELQPKTSQADLGDRIAILDAQGRQIGTMPKGAAPKGDDFGEIGRDAYDRPIYGYRNYGQKTVTQPKIEGPGATAQAAPVDMNGKPIPAGVDPKQVRETQSKDYATSTVPVDPKQVAEVRKEVMDLPSYKNLRQAAPIYQSMLATADNDSKASDLNLIYGMGKIMDPGSVVREGELALANGTSGLDERLIGLAKGVMGGSRLGPETRASLMKEAHIRMKAYEDQFGFDSNHYKGIAGRMRANAEDIIPAYPKAEPYVSKAEREAQAKKGAATTDAPAAPGADGYTVIDGVKIRRR